MSDWRFRLTCALADLFAGGPWRYEGPQLARLQFQDKMGCCFEVTVYSYSKEERRWKRDNHLVPRGSKLERAILYSWLVDSTHIFPLEDREITRTESIPELESLLLRRFLMRTIPVLIVLISLLALRSLT